MNITTRVLRGPDGSRAAALLEANARRVLEQGFDGCVLDADFTHSEWDVLVRYFPSGSVRAAFAFAPLPLPTPLGKEPPPSLVSLDPSEVATAKQRLMQQAEFLGGNGIARLIVPAAEISVPSGSDVRRALGTAEMAGLPRVIEQLQRRRSTSKAARHELDSYLRVLDALLSVVDRHQIEVALMPGAFPSEIPDAAELSSILAEFRGAPLAVVANTLSLERALFCQVPGASTFLDDFGDRLSGVVLEDGHLLRGTMPVGQGSVSFVRWRPIRARETGVDWTLELSEGAADGDLETGFALLESLDSPCASNADSNPSPFLDKSLRDLV